MKIEFDFTPDEWKLILRCANAGFWYLNYESIAEIQTMEALSAAIKEQLPNPSDECTVTYDTSNPATQELSKTYWEAP